MQHTLLNHRTIPSVRALEVGTQILDLRCNAPCHQMGLSRCSGLVVGHMPVRSMVLIVVVLACLRQMQLDLDITQIAQFQQ